MKCPHCLTEFHDDPTDTILLRGKTALQEKDGLLWRARSRLCPACGRAIVALVANRLVSMLGGGAAETKSVEYLIWPRGITRSPLPKEVPEKYAADYREACNVLAESAKASAALSRRCLQLILREVAGVKASDLNKEIEAVLPSLPSSIAGAVDAVRVIGNFAAHPIKSTNTGEIVDVEPGEAEWSLDVLESLFDFYFVQPAKLAAKKAEMNKKLSDAGKPPMK